MPTTVEKSSYAEWSVSIWRLNSDEGSPSLAENPEATLREAIGNSPGAPPINGIIVDPVLTSGVAIAGEPVIYHVDRPPERASYWFIFGPPAVVDE